MHKERYTSCGFMICIVIVLLLTVASGGLA